MKKPFLSLAALLLFAFLPAITSADGLLKGGASEDSLKQSIPATVAVGGTGDTTLTANGVLYGNGTGAVTVLAAGSNNTCLKSNGASAPSFGSCAGGALNLTTQCQDLSSSACTNTAATCTLGTSETVCASASFAAGTWLFLGHGICSSAAAETTHHPNIQVDLFDSTNSVELARGGCGSTNNAKVFTATMAAVEVLAGTATIQLRSIYSGTITAAPTLVDITVTQGFGQGASAITAVKLA